MCVCCFVKLLCCQVEDDAERDTDRAIASEVSDKAQSSAADAIAQENL
jgi:hypothetical protein